jgi:transposase InsO family protein
VPVALAAFSEGWLGGVADAVLSSVGLIALPDVWRSLKYEEVYLREYRLVPEARVGIRRYFQFYNYERSHQSLEYRTPADLYRGVRP